MGTYTRLKVAAEAYAVPVGNVVEIASLGDLTAVPGAPREILGVRNLRGQILPVIDLALLLGLTAAAPPKQLLVAEAGNVQAGFAIDEVSNVGELPDPNEGAESDFLLGTMFHDGELLGVIDVPRIFGSLQRAP
jgi:chemotaxis signal transduction protein